MNVSKKTTSAAIAVLLFSIPSFFAQDTEFQVQSITVDPNGNLAIEFPSADGSYYLLKRGPTVDVTDTGIDGQIGVNGTGTLRDVTVNGINQAFYVIEKISVAEPLDMDEDGIDDVYELQNPNFLNPFDAADAALDFDLDGSSNLKEYQDGTDPTQLPFNSAKITSVNPVNGEARVNITREAVVHFDSEMDPTGITADTFYMQIGGSPVSGRVEVSSTNRFATFFPDEALPTGAQVQVVVDGSAIKDMEGNMVDGDGDNLPGGTSRTIFRTLSNKRIDGTNLWGYVKDSFSGEPLEGAMIYVNAFPNASATTDSEGHFELSDMPAPEFFVHIIGATVSNVPDGFTYPNVGKPFRSVPGQTVQISKDGKPFDIFLPPMALGDTVNLSNTEVTDVGFGAGGKSSLTALFPGTDPGVWDGVTVEIAPGSARDDIGGTFSQAAIIPVPPDRIPEPLPQGLGMPVVISIQAPGATRFDVPAPVTFPNLPDPVTGQVLLPGEKTGLWSFDHDAGLWILQGSMTVSDDGLFLVSDPGVGVSAPGWHGPSNGNSGNGGGGGDDDEQDEPDPCARERNALLGSVVQCSAGIVAGAVELTPGIGCAVSLSIAAGGAAFDCYNDPGAGCAISVAKNGYLGVVGCIPGAGLAARQLAAP